MDITARSAAPFNVTRYRAELTVYTGERTTRDDGTPGGWVYVNVWCTHEHATPSAADACRARIARYLRDSGPDGLDRGRLESVGATC